MIKSFVFFIGIAFTSIAFSGTYTYEIKQAMRECSIEQNAFKSNGTPSCDRVKDLMKLQRLETEAETSEKTGREMPSHHNYGNDE